MSVLSAKAVGKTGKKDSGKKVVANLRLTVVAGQVVPNPKIASVLGPKGIQIPKFCDEVNKVTKRLGQSYSIGDLVTVLVPVYSDRSYDFIIKDSPVSFLLLKAMDLKKGSSTAGMSSVGTVALSDVEKIALRKLPDMTAFSKEAAIKTVMGVAKSMGILVESNG